MPDGNHLAGCSIKGDGARFIEHDAFTLDVDKRVGRAQIDSNVACERNRVGAGHCGALETREENLDFPCGRFCRIASVDEILGEDGSQVTTNGAGCRSARVGSTHHRPQNLPRVVRARHHHRHDWAARHEFNKVGIKRLALVLGIVVGQGGFVEGAQLHRIDR